MSDFSSLTRYTSAGAASGGRARRSGYGPGAASGRRARWYGQGSPARLVALVGALLLVACAAAPPFESPPVDAAPQPYRVVESIDQWVERDVLWGGMIIEVRNFANHSEVEVLAFPVDSRQRPIPHAADQGRFIALLSGFADPATLPEGRFLTLTGRITGDRRGPLRNREYVWPEVDVGQLHLWPEDFRTEGSRWSIGIGVGIR